MTAQAHGYAGQRFFPATMAVDDPFVADEAGVLVGNRKAPTDDGDMQRTTTTSAEFARTLTPDLAVSVGGNWQHQRNDSGQTANGFDDTEIGAKYLLHTDAAHETIVSVGLNASLGGTGSPRVGANSHTTLSPALYFGKGFGDLPDSLGSLRPLAITGVIAPNISTDHSGTQSVDWGLSFQYSLPYREAFVKDDGLASPLKRLIPVVELPMNTCTTGACAGRTTGTINPGVMWIGKTMQLGIEAQVPINRASGSHTGLLLQTHFYLDDLFPHTFGHPVWGN